tara:strand:+ start:1224 stop:1925 length:702 start_codon:yes stop_codon:yes gene_type:complete
MKIKKYFVIIYVLVSNLFYAQEAEIVYKSIYFDVPDVKIDKDIKTKVSREINDMKYLLRYTKKQSFFEGLPHVPHDKFMAKMAIGVTQSHVEWYQYPNEKQSYHNKKIKDSIYRVKYEERMQKWDLHNEKKEIDGYVCYKATIDYTHPYTENQFIIEAWYTPEIPVPYGPVGYGGLPGLILQLKHSHVIYIAQEITLNPIGGIKPIKDLKPGRLIDADEKRKLQQKARKVTED